MSSAPPLSDTNPRIVSFAPEHAAAFKTLNLDWIRQHWEPEPADFKVLDHPQRNILDGGGYIAIAMLGTNVVGTCALIKADTTTYELAKMAVDDVAKGRGIGRKLGEDVIAKARSLGAKRIYLESNTVLTPALNLYRQLGFREVHGFESPYERADIQMELLF